MERQRALDSLVKHHSSQVYKPENHYTNLVNDNGKYLKTYIPYIGEDYFNTKPRVLIYAMAQNLARASGLIRKWQNTLDEGMLRQYYNAEKGYVAVHPYDTGHLKVIVALVLCAFSGTNYSPADNVNKKIAITNFVKFSFYREGKNGQRLDANPPFSIYGDMWKYFSKYEIELLTPDIVIGTGNDVFKAIRNNLSGEVKLLGIPFPGRLNLSSRFIPKGNTLIKKGHNRQEDIARIRSLIVGTPDRDGKIAKAIRIDWYYFKEMESYFEKCLSPNSNK